MIASRTALFMSDDDRTPVKAPIERGVSMDQDGKSNVWAIEPKMEIENKSSEEKTGSALLAVGGLAVFGAIAAVALSNLPDPNQF
jgi:Ni,Fe-hydrogenase I small subunit